MHRRFVVAFCGVAQLLASLGSAVPSQFSVCRFVVAASGIADGPAALCLHRSIQRFDALRRKSCPLSPYWPQWTAGAAVGEHRRDVAIADAAPQQLGPALVVVNRFHRCGAFCSA